MSTLKQYRLTVREISEQDFWIVGDSVADAQQRFWNEPGHCTLTDDETTSIDIVTAVELAPYDPDYDADPESRP